MRNSIVNLCAVLLSACTVSSASDGGTDRPDLALIASDQLLQYDLARSFDSGPTYERDLAGAPGLQPDLAPAPDLADTGCGGDGQGPCSWGCSAGLGMHYRGACAQPRSAVCAYVTSVSCGSYPLSCCTDATTGETGLCSGSTYCMNSTCEPCP